MRISDWSSDVCSSDLPTASLAGHERERVYETIRRLAAEGKAVLFVSHFIDEIMALTDDVTVLRDGRTVLHAETAGLEPQAIAAAIAGRSRSEEHTSELQSLMRISYAVFCLKKKKTHKQATRSNIHMTHQQ